VFSFSRSKSLVPESSIGCVNRDKASLDISWLKDESLEESDNLPDPDVLAQEIVVPRLVSLGTTPSQGIRPSRVLRRGVEDLDPPSNNSAKSGLR
jgi:hypothetical protein